LLISTDICWYLSIFANIDQHLLISTDIYRCLLISANICQYLPISVNINRYLCYMNNFLHLPAFRSCHMTDRYHLYHLLVSHDLELYFGSHSICKVKRTFIYLLLLFKVIRTEILKQMNYNFFYKKTIILH